MKKGGAAVTENDPDTTGSGKNPNSKPTEPRVPRSIRFSDSEWANIEKEAKARGMTAAELVRHAAVSVATSKLSADSQTFSPEVGAQIERIYRGVYLLSTRKRDKMIREGRQEECDRIGKDARDSQDSIRHVSPKPAS